MGFDWQSHWVLFNTFLILVSALEEQLGPEPINPNNKDVQSALDFAVESFNRFSTDDHLFKVTRVVSAQVKDIGGLLYFLEADLGRTQCKKGTNKALISCFVVNTPGNSEHRFCHFKVLNTFWRNEKYLLKSNCNPVNR
ncbi:cystatin-C-like [Chiloscyllium plagiosum]|uniref:cystatin-C-like n=1 Tax=Chiloscyllium plagiosum TaxID=36176 RepID=UPI001CB82B02|nr:cystatin-C-like [Chiloscyllium plagiosum]